MKHTMRTTLTLLSAMLLLGCGGPTPQEDRKKDTNKGGLLVMNQFQSFSTLHPPSSYESSAGQVGGHVFETLVGYDSETLEIKPLLAESWEVNDEGTEYTLQIRDNVYFHDNECFDGGKGRELEVDDVIYCLKFLCSQDPSNKKSWLMTDQIVGGREFYDQKKRPRMDDLEGIEDMGRRKIKISLTRPNMEFLHLLSHYSTSIYPRESVKHYGKLISEKMVGTGPFVLKTMRKEKVCVLERNGDYWGVDADGNSLPYLIGIKIGFANKGQEILPSMQKGVLHVMPDIDEVEGGERLMSFVDKSSGEYVQEFGEELGVVYLAFLNDQGVFSEKKVREAFALTIDKEEIATEVLNGNGEAAMHGFVPVGFPDYPYNMVKTQELDPERALELMSDAGYASPQDFPITTLQIQNSYRDVMVAEEIQRQVLEKLGISLSITTLPRDQHFDRAAEGKTVLWIDNWIADYRAPQSFLEIMLSSNTPDKVDSYLNTYRYVSPSYDDLIGHTVKIKDVKERNEKYARADKLMTMEDVAILPLYYERSKVIRKNTVKNLQPPLFGRLDLREVYIEE